MHSKTPIQCSLCPKILFTKAAIRTHINQIHKHKKHECFCGQTFETYASLWYHRKGHSSVSKPADEIKCQRCSKIFTYSSNFKKHFLSQHGPRQPCEFCGKMIPSSEIQKHHQMFHKSVTCSIEGCNKNFVNATKMKYHLKNEHVSKPSKCPTCNVELPSEFKLKRHIYYQHGKKWKCQVSGCNHVSSRRDYLLMHVRNHRGISDSEKQALTTELEGFKDHSRFRYIEPVAS